MHVINPWTQKPDACHFPNFEERDLAKALKMEIIWLVSYI